MALDGRFAKALRKKARRGFGGYPVATVAFYGPDDKRASKVAVGIVIAEGEEVAEMKRWFSDQGDVRQDAGVQRAVLEFVRTWNVHSVAMADGIIGCPHEEGIDYPDGQTCPQCPFWANRDRWTGKIVR